MTERKPDTYDLYDLVEEYRKMFSEGPPTFGYSEEDVVAEILKALRTGRRMPGADRLIMKKTGLKPEEFEI